MPAAARRARSNPAFLFRESIARTASPRRQRRHVDGTIERIGANLRRNRLDFPDGWSRLPAAVDRASVAANVGLSARDIVSAGIVTRAPSRIERGRTHAKPAVAEH